MDAVRLDGCTVHFPEHYDDRGEWEAEAKGWLQGVEVEMPDGHRYPLFFYDPVRLAQDLEARRTDPPALVAEPGMVIVPEVTRATILDAVTGLARATFFDRIRPVVPANANGVAH